MSFFLAFNYQMTFFLAYKLSLNSYKIFVRISCNKNGTRFTSYKNLKDLSIQIDLEYL